MRHEGALCGSCFYSLSFAHEMWGHRACEEDLGQSLVGADFFSRPEEAFGKCFLLQAVYFAGLSNTNEKEPPRTTFHSLSNKTPKVFR